MLRLGRSDLEDILRFIADVSERDLDDPYAPEVLAGLQQLVHCAEVVYQDANLADRRFEDTRGAGPDNDAAIQAQQDAVYWAVGPCPISDYRSRTGDLAAARMTDVIGSGDYHELPIYREYFRPSGVEHMLDIGLPAGPARHRSLLFFREMGVSDFSARDRVVLDTLRPHFAGIEARAMLRRRLSEVAADGTIEGHRATSAQLTAREKEIVVLVGQGKTNAQIAAELWVAPSTVKKHLENVYGKVGVGSRAAATNLLRV